MVEKKPYFFKYLYKDSKVLYNKFLQEEENYRQINKIDVNNIMAKPESQWSGQERYYIDSMRYRNPLIDSNCEMNRVCHYIESVDFNIRRFNNNNQNKVYKKYIDIGIKKNTGRYALVKKTLKDFIKFLQCDISMSDYASSQRMVPEEEQKIISKYEIFKDKMGDVCSNSRELTNYLVELFYSEFKSLNKDFLWKCYGNIIFSNIYENSDKTIRIPEIVDDGEFEYLFDKYNIVEVRVDG